MALINSGLPLVRRWNVDIKNFRLKGTLSVRVYQHLNKQVILETQKNLASLRGREVL